MDSYNCYAIYFAINQLFYEFIKNGLLDHNRPYVSIKELVYCKLAHFSFLISVSKLSFLLFLFLTFVQLSSDNMNIKINF